MEQDGIGRDRTRDDGRGRTGWDRAVSRLHTKLMGNCFVPH